MEFWTKEEYLKFAEVMMDRPIFYYAFEVLYWSGIREGELLALTPSDFDFEKQTLRIDKNYQRIGTRDIIQTPKTSYSTRTVKIPKFLCDEMQDCLKQFYHIGPNDRIFPLTKHRLYTAMKSGSEQAGVKKIRVHDLRHPYVKHTTKKYNSEKQKTQATKIDLIAWVFRFCIFNYSKRSWTL